MYRTSEAIDVELLRRCEAKEGAPFVGNPNLITHNIPRPHAEFGSASCELHALLRLAQVSFVRLQLPRELCPPHQVAANLVAHRCYHAKICEAGQKWGLDNSPDH